MTEKTLHEALAAFGITSRPGTFPFKRALIRNGQELGEYDASEGWKLVHQLSEAPASPAA